MYSTIAPDSASTVSPSVISGDFPNSCSAFMSGGAAPVASRWNPLHPVGRAQLLEEPDDPLGARAAQVVDGDHDAMAVRMPRRMSRGGGGQPGTTTSTGSPFETPPHVA